ncbi:uncharacterized protein LOC135440908 [Drosophila montana]|uniref:uncharacterized protein LOC135440908 n=1 Tax=Drosophila montana TaxID=40370 RepID=UPI00313CF543
MSHALGRSPLLLVLLLLLGSGALLSVDGKTVHRRTDKISENFKQLDLPPEEIDPNVAPPETEPQKPAAADLPAPETASVVDAIVDESANEIASVDAAPAAAAAAVAEITTAKPKPTTTTTTTKPQEDGEKNPISRYCKCSESHCDCCRKFGLPLLPSGPGCAKISYLGNDEMSVSLKFGEITLASRRISSKRARPICVGMPGGYSKFCGRVYGLSRAKENFKACLAFELRAEDEVEAQLPISCFKFGAEGLRVAEAEPLPTKIKQEEDDDDDDIFGFGAGGDDDDEDEDEDDYDDGDGNAEPSAEDDDADADDYAEDDDTEAPEDADYGGFSLGGLLDELDDDEDDKPSKKPAVAASPAAASPAVVDQTTREHVETDTAQSKDEAGTPVAAGEAPPVVEEAPAAAAVTASPVEATTAKVTKSKKAKKNKKKKKKAANDTAGGGGGGDFAYELLNGILDFFN